MIVVQERRAWGAADEKLNFLQSSESFRPEEKCGALPVEDRRGTRLHSSRRRRSYRHKGFAKEATKATGLRYGKAAVIYFKASLQEYFYMMTWSGYHRIQKGACAMCRQPRQFSTTHWHYGYLSGKLVSGCAREAQ